MISAYLYQHSECCHALLHYKGISVWLPSANKFVTLKSESNKLFIILNKYILNLDRKIPYFCNIFFVFLSRVGKCSIHTNKRLYRFPPRALQYTIYSHTNIHCCMTYCCMERYCFWQLIGSLRYSRNFPCLWNLKFNYNFEKEPCFIYTYIYVYTYKNTRALLFLIQNYMNLVRTFSSSFM